MGLVSTKLRNSARGQQCQFRVPGVCNNNPETTVLCHAPSEVKGMSNKGDDHFAAFGCFECHTALDQHRVDDPPFFWLRGIRRTQAIWFEMGLMVVPIDAVKPHTSGKIMARRHILSGEVYAPDIVKRGELMRPTRNPDSGDC